MLLASDIFLNTKIRQAMISRGVTDPAAIAAVIEIVKEVEAGLIDMNNQMWGIANEALKLKVGPIFVTPPDAA